MSANLESPASSAKPIRILALCDSPVVGNHPFPISTGFGRVARNILGDWCQRDEVTVDCYAINFDGWGYTHSPFRLFPAGGRDWNSPTRLQRFLTFLVEGGYTHLWMLMDPDALSVHGFPAALKKACKENNIRTLLYYPVDCQALERNWLAILDAVDVAVTFTRHGVDVTRWTLGKSLYPVEVIPHGVDGEFKPLPLHVREAYRKVVVGDIDFIQPGDFFMLNVNKNEWRKDPLRSLEILKALRERGIPAKLVLRMAQSSAMGGIYLDIAAKQLGLTFGKEWICIDAVSDAELCGLYNAADLYLTTSMGEGWGLGVTEAMACHCPVAMAQHTSLAEIGDDNTFWLPMEKNFVCGADTRLRRRVDVPGAVDVLEQAYKGKLVGNGIRHEPAANWGKPWKAVADEMFAHLTMGGVK